MGGSIGKKKSKIIIVGLDNSGKSTMIQMLKPKKVKSGRDKIMIIVPRSRDCSYRGLQSRAFLKAED